MQPTDTQRELRPVPEAFVPDAAELALLPPVEGGWCETVCQIIEREFKLLVPRHPDLLLDTDEVRGASRIDDYMPYWAYLWPAALRMSEAVLRYPWPDETRVLELGCGAGLVGIAALASGCHVTFTDYDVTAVALARRNAERNGFDQLEAIRLDWRSLQNQRYPVIMGCDITYEIRNHVPILNLIEAALEPDGVCWLADGGRSTLSAFCALARERRFSVTFQVQNLPSAAVPGSAYQLMELRRQTTPN